jgi:hypothetical protein
MSQSIQATTPSRIGDPEPAGRHASPANLSAPFVANARHTGSWLAESTFTQKEPEARILGKLEDPLSGKKASSGGTSDTDVNEPTAIPAGRPCGSIPVTTTTPVGNRPSTCLNRAESNSTGEPAVVIDHPPRDGHAHAPPLVQRAAGRQLVQLYIAPAPAAPRPPTPGQGEPEPRQRPSPRPPAETVRGRLMPLLHRRLTRLSWSLRW